MSPFAEALKCLLDDACDYTREEWVGFLFVHVIGEKDYEQKRLALIESWLKDEALPRPSDLEMIWLMLTENYASMSESSRQVFWEIAHRRATEVSPLGNRMLPTVWEYMNRTSICELSSKLAKLSPEEQGRLLEKMFPAPAK